MDWFTALEKKRRFVLVSIILLMVATIAVTSMRDPRSVDSFWQLKMGQDWIENGLSPWEDHYSFTYPGEKVISPPVGFQVTLHLLAKQFGLTGGFKLYKFLSMMLALVMMIWWLHQIKAPVFLYCLTLPLLVALLQFRATTRPELISYSFIVLAIIFYRRTKADLSIGKMLPIILLMLIWNNYHSSIFGYIIFFGLFIDSGLSQLKQNSTASTWFKWFGWGLVLVALGFVNPSLSHPLIAAFTFPNEWKILIQEYSSPIMYKNVPSFYVFIFISIITLFLCWKQKLYGFLFVCLFLLSNAATMARLVAPTGIVVLCVFAYAASKIDFERLLSGDHKLSRFAIPTGAAIVFFVPLFFNVISARDFIAQNSLTIGYYPSGMVEYMKDSGRSGRILNEYDIGGFLIYHLAPESQVYIDGRTNILYPLTHYQRLRDVWTSAEDLAEEITKYDVQFVIARNTSDKALLLEQTGMLQLDYADVRYFLYSRETGNTPTAGRLWARPYCWSDEDKDLLIEESLVAAVFYTPNTQLHQFMNLMISFGDAEERLGYLEQQNNTVYWPDASKRFVAYRALELGNFNLARHHFFTVQTKDPKDYMAIALAQLREGEPGAAEATLAEALGQQWQLLESSDLVIMHALLLEVREAKEWEILDDSYIDNFADQIGGYQIAEYDRKVDAKAFCADFD